MCFVNSYKQRSECTYTIMNDSKDPIFFLKVCSKSAYLYLIFNCSTQYPYEEECYDRPDGIDEIEFRIFERNMGGYATCAVGLIGIIGNLINLGVLSHKEMRGSCFNQLLIGKFILKIVLYYL